MNTPSNTTTETDKRYLYKTAKARISCAKFSKDEFVSVQYKGQNWYAVTGGEKGKFETPVMYPEKHLTSFCL